MSTISGLPAHVLLVHFVVVLVPMTALLLVMCALWPAARRRLLWLLVALAAATVVLTPLTTDAGEWLEHRIGRSPALHTHTHLGDTMIYFVVPMLVIAALIVALDISERRAGRVRRGLAAVVAILAVASAAASVVQIYRVGESGARAVWGDTVVSAPTAPADGQ
ncbi:hypothetical protein FOS14_01680 [Skermania sp. ID1734]|uniref:DUF2231 domain-containing protein n=1 Tax=Skermania sp. ID1734 TaxID=2597516 RepID=UPI001180DEDE|nr:DUF2231 domain-containing protein [Skermania sp. ID1734]TSE02118.1 hypothetical protein FOS14_01680 [Skermania sp. ID1734]